MLTFEILLPVPPTADKIAIVEIVLNEVIGDGEENSGFRAGVGRHPVIRMCGAIRQPHIKNNELGPLIFAFDNALGVWVEVMPCLQVCTNKQNHFGIGVVRAWSVESHPVMIAGASA